MSDLFSYPHKPGAKERGGTSQEAAKRIGPRVGPLQRRILDLMKAVGDFTADELARALNESILAVRPRVSELHKLDLIEKSPRRRKNKSGASAVVWRVK